MLEGINAIIVRIPLLKVPTLQRTLRNSEFNIIPQGFPRRNSGLKYDLYATLTCSVSGYTEDGPTYIGQLNCVGQITPEVEDELNDSKSFVVTSLGELHNLEALVSLTGFKFAYPLSKIRKANPPAPKQGRSKLSDKLNLLRKSR